ncbi:MAG: TIGR03084 family metal-binding protein [Intrasporangium sp.]|uniref:TIGR03084 family metal-binding protein n=1 Tax=Intrasporangium sp. TaxID=1925024 RepID=UPI002648EA1E|nr:TIGR03084 family metal-binding protein [Intrasporangium sp.]MDN5794775.1 TIGR03084 family metal-binding protein [Intrasporangium sp.]
MSDAVAATVQSFLDECADLDRLVAGLPAEDWGRDTPAVGWTVAHQVAHLAWTDEVALLALVDTEAFAAAVQATAADPIGYVDRGAAAGAIPPYAAVLARWRAGREALASALRAADPSTPVPWFGPPMSPRSMATARLMEAWAHGQDVADALGVRRAPTDRLRDICHLGVRTRDFGYRINGLEPPAGPFRVELTGPGGEAWTWGPQDAPDRVRGSAEEFCLVVAQRREAPDTDLFTQGEATRWLTFAQVFAGEPKKAVRARNRA